MGFLLKEALKRICGENRWSYAVFWRIGYQNPTLLVWEEHHYKPARDFTLPGIAGTGSTQSLLKEWEGLWGSPQTRFPQLACQVDDDVCSLVNKMMINKQVHVVGEGMVGRAASSGNHQWILQEDSMMEGYPLEVLSEVHHQFSARMQTIAVIPVLPHGVIQLGSTLAIVENMWFVNDVRSLFAQLDVLGALSSGNYTNKDPDQKIASLGESIAADTARNSCSQLAIFTPFISAGCNQEISTSQASGCGSQPCYSLMTQTQVDMQPIALSLQTAPCLPPSTANSVDDLFQIKAFPVIKPNLPLRGQIESGLVGDQVIMSSTDAWLNQWASPYNSSSSFNQQLVQSGSSFNTPLFLEQQILPSAGLQESVNNSLPASNYTSTSQLRSNGGKICNSLKDSAIFPVLGGSESPDLQMLTSNLCGSAMNNTSCHPQEGLELTSFNMSVVPASDHKKLSKKNYVLHGVPHRSHPSTNDNHTQNECPTGKQMAENDLFQALNMPSVHSGEHISRCHPKLDFLHNWWVRKHDKGGPRSQNVISEDEHAQPPPSGDDLLDILGLDYKSKELCGSWNDFHIHGADANTQNESMDVSACTTQINSVLDCYAMNDGISGSGIFSETGSDHLLDAVVSKVHSSTKQNSDNNMSCQTTLTKVGGSSVLTDSPKCEWVSAQDQKQGPLFGFSPPLAKSLLTGPSSFKSGCGKDNAGECSQINSMYSSQINSLGEDSQNMKCDNSISTANSRRPDETGKTNRKRLKPGENPRPRPKDRQMIQDRVKELREIVPDGVKCSIDALLERTVKHMLFLQSVTKHADMLKQTGEPKIVSKEGGLLSRDNFEGGATLAFDVRSQSMVCPIIVEDLNAPRQMLVEMLCEEQGFFLEIADMVRGLGLTILNGMMEARNDKVWVRFTVEANRDVTRMEIFLSLVHLLEQAGKCTTSKGTDSTHMMSHNTFHQVVIPAATAV